jgi:hypothetical protein
MIRKFAAGLVCLSWGLWFGGMSALFLFVTRLFAVDRDMAIHAAPVLFASFEKFQYVVGPIALLAVSLWRLDMRSKSVTALVYLIFLTFIVLIVGSIFFVHPMFALIQQSLGDSDQFKKLHGLSMLMYSTQELLLILIGLILPSAIAGKRKMGIR